jgi:hypothetical protein
MNGAQSINFVPSTISLTHVHDGVHLLSIQRGYCMAPEFGIQMEFPVSICNVDRKRPFAAARLNIESTQGVLGDAGQQGERKLMCKY